MQMEHVNYIRRNLEGGTYEQRNHKRDISTIVHAYLQYCSRIYNNCGAYEYQFKDAQVVIAFTCYLCNLGMIPRSCKCPLLTLPMPVKSPCMPSYSDKGEGLGARFVIASLIKDLFTPFNMICPNTKSQEQGKPTSMITSFKIPFMRGHFHAV